LGRSDDLGAATELVETPVDLEGAERLDVVPGRWLRGRRRYGAVAGPLRPDPIDAHRFQNVLELALAEIVARDRQPVLDLLVDRPRDTDAPGLRQAFQPGREVDPVAVDALAFHEDVAQRMPIRNAIRRSAGSSVFRMRSAFWIPTAHARRSRRSGTRRGGCRRRVYDVASVLDDDVAHRLPVSGEGAKRRRLVGRHETAEPDRVPRS